MKFRIIITAAAVAAALMFTPGLSAQEQTGGEDDISTPSELIKRLEGELQQTETQGKKADAEKIKARLKDLRLTEKRLFIIMKIEEAKKSGNQGEVAKLTAELDALDSGEIKAHLKELEEKVKVLRTGGSEVEAVKAEYQIREIRFNEDIRALLAEFDQLGKDKDLGQKADRLLEKGAGLYREFYEAGKTLTSILIENAVKAGDKAAASNFEKRLKMQAVNNGIDIANLELKVAILKKDKPAIDAVKQKLSDYRSRLQAMNREEIKETAKPAQKTRADTAAEKVK